MRLLPWLSALVLTTTTFTTQIASACGPYGHVEPAPQVMLVSSHHMHTRDLRGEPTEHTRGFVLFGNSTEVTGTHEWPFVAPMTFDSTRVRDGGTATPETVTLIGPSGMREVTTGSRRVLLAGAFFKHGAVHEAAEVGMRAGDNFEIAVRGRVPAAAWHGLEYTADDTLRVSGTKLWIDRSSTGDQDTVVVRAGARVLGSYRGTALGVLAIDGSRYLITRVNGQPRVFDLRL